MEYQYWNMEEAIIAVLLLCATLGCIVFIWADSIRRERNRKLK